MTQMPPPYAQQTVAGAAPHRGTLILVLGIISLVVCAPVGIFAWLMGRGDLNKMKVGAMDPSGKGLTQGGMICGIIATVLMVLGILFYVLIFVVVGIGAAASAGAH